MASETKNCSLFLRILHWVIIVNFVLEVIYGAYMIFFVVGGGGPLGNSANTLDPDVFMARRLYAIETWIAIAGLSLYLAITEYLPKLLRNK